MEYFNIEKYKDWEQDTEYSSDDTSKFFKKDDKKVKIRFYEDDIIIRTYSINNPYMFVKSYFLNKSLKCSGIDCYEFHIGIWKFYDKDGKLIKETDYDKPYKFSLKEVVKKVKKEYDTDLEDKTQRCVLERFESDELNNKSFYGVSLRDKENPSKIDYILLDASTGETLFTTYFMLRDNSIPPFTQYLESLKKAE